MDDFSKRPKKKNLLRKQDNVYYDFDSVDIEELLAEFPLPRYFQIHFSHVHENCEQVKQQFNDLSQRIERIEKKLDRVLAAMTEGQI